MSEQHPLKQPLILLITEVKESAALMRDLAEQILNLIQDTNEALLDLDRRVRALEEWALDEINQET